MNQLLLETLAAVRAAGFEPRVERNRHLKISFIDAQQRRRVIVVSNSPSCPFAIKRNRALLRRILRVGGFNEGGRT